MAVNCAYITVFQKFCRTRGRLINTRFITFLQPKSKTKELYNQACTHLAAQGMLDTDLFGLAVIVGKYKTFRFTPRV